MKTETTNKLLAPAVMGNLEIRNRVVMAPLTRARSGKDRIPNELMAEYYAQRSSAGLIISEATTISAQANGWNETPGIYTEEMRDGWRKVVDAVHEKGGKIFLQLWHMGRASHSSYLPDGQPIVAPSAIAIQGEDVETPHGKKSREVPHALTTSEIADIVLDYGQAALFAKDSGADGVEIHAANGYLIDQFLQSKSNTREDQYGGSVENRHRFLSEVIRAVCDAWPAIRVGVRLSPNGIYNDMGSTDYREQFLYTASQLDEVGLAYLHVIDGLGFGFHDLGEAMALSEFREVFTGPLMGNCGYGQASAEARIANGEADLIAIGRPFINNPDLVERYTNNWPLAEIEGMDHWSKPHGALGYTDFPAFSR